MIQGIDTRRPPSGPGCVECERDGSWWFHLRRCTECGHVGCCDDSLGQHASAHAEESGHRFIQSYEPGEDWFWDYRTAQMVDGPELAPPRSHPAEQTVPGPRERVPADWQDQLLRARSERAGRSG
ncbi:UBP-type zinc finger domain-containing protein [Microbacterium azadirachtae]|uniref:UBP-type zinc finger domain-containing protein n=1 Tax=Microbacterium azadirachtae TaxID=582680 RepID=UPI00088886BE|nr:UBP-type zinc finger domain-containing protein [Microbacterium azadirachtae]UXW87181.1 UBP-type zinc finger domain-containing protein [Microbacterium azadirachtae]SDL13525.1 ubiquitin-hydrolase Zn-finger-containing protein [Microbacterium azadirachtae]SEF43378.1 ubiquitin-hydrolase Zn-finger-containing protein [Microbacterium azadirachtae]SEF43412.1 ubiquitin-hydrolase Zn-finger-containing protein [Microbacterium azadirachtae]